MSQPALASEMLIPRFELFSGVPDHDAKWLETIDGFEAAKSRMHEFANSAPGRYFLFSLASYTVIDAINTGRPNAAR